MSDDREERIRDHWYHTYKSWDAADDRRRAERGIEISRLRTEGARPGRESDASPAAASGLPPVPSSEAELLDRIRTIKTKLLSSIEHCSDLLPSWERRKWHDQLSGFDVTLPVWVAETQLESLRGSIADFHGKLSSHIFPGEAAAAVVLSDQLLSLRNGLISFKEECSLYWSHFLLQKRLKPYLRMTSALFADPKVEPIQQPEQLLARPAPRGGGKSVLPSDDPATVIKCPICAVEVKAKNLARHFNRSGHPLWKLPKRAPGS